MRRCGGLDGRHLIMTKQVATLTSIKRDGYRASDVFDGIRALFGKGSWERQPIDMNRIVLSVNELFARRVGSSWRGDPLRVDGRVTFGQRPWGSVAGGCFQPDQQRGRSYGRHNQPKSMLRLRTEVCGRDQIVVSVENSGPGIDPRQLEKVFNAFVSTKAHGTGLGLAICRMIVEGHGGRLTRIIG